MKSYTNLEQSKKLAEFLPLDSADMCYRLPYEEGDKPLLEQGGFGSTPCWSLAALLDISPYIEVGRELYGAHHGKWYCRYTTGDYQYKTIDDELVDAVVGTIYKLKEKDLL